MGNFFKERGKEGKKSKKGRKTNQRVAELLGSNSCHREKVKSERQMTEGRGGKKKAEKRSLETTTRRSGRPYRRLANPLRGATVSFGDNRKVLGRKGVSKAPGRASARG